MNQSSYNMNHSQSNYFNNNYKTHASLDRSTNSLHDRTKSDMFWLNRKSINSKFYSTIMGSSSIVMNKRKNIPSEESTIEQFNELYNDSNAVGSLDKWKTDNLGSG